jgi:hypothetical protein
MYQSNLYVVHVNSKKKPHEISNTRPLGCVSNSEKPVTQLQMQEYIPAHGTANRRNRGRGGYDHLLIRIPDLDLHLAINNRFDRNAGQIFHNPIRTSLLELVQRVRRLQRNHLEPSSLTSLDTRRCILEYDNRS